MSNPFMGLKPYEKKDKGCYKGRNEDIRKFIRILDDGDFSVIYSESGIGKSSFLNAGITPVLESDGKVPVNISFDFVQAPVQDKECKDFIIKSITGTIEKSLSEHHQSWRFVYSEQVPETDRYKFTDSLWSVLRTFTVCDGEDQKMIVLIFDQFEEIFTKAPDVFRKTFFQTIEELGSDIPPKELIEELDRLNDASIPLQLDVQQEYKVIFSLRKEYLAEFDYWTNDVYHLPQLLRNRMTLLPLSGEQACEVITDQRVDGNRLTLFDDVYDDIIKFITKGGRRNHLNGYDGQIVEPLLLSMLCYNLYEKYSGNHKIPASSKWGFDLNNYVWDFYDSAISKIVRKKSHRAIIEKALVDEYGHRNRTKTSSGPLHNIGFTESYQKKLDDSHIIRTDDEYIELIHDRLADVIFKKRKQQFSVTGVITIYAVLLIVALSIIAITFRVDYSTMNPSRITDYSIIELVPENGVYYVNDTKEIRYDYEKVYVNDTIGSVKGLPRLRELILSSGRANLDIQNCEGLSALVLNDDIASLHIDNCPQIRYLHLPASLRHIDGLKRNMDSVEFILPKDNTHFHWSDGVLWNLDTESIVYIRADADSIITFPEHTVPDGNESFTLMDGRRFSNRAFADTVSIINDTTLLKVYMPKDSPVIDLSKYISVTEIGDSLFMDYKSATRIILPPNAKTIGNSAFRDCKSLETIENMDSVTTIGKYAFAGCKSLTEIKLPALLSKVGAFAFMDCSSLKSVTMPYSDSIFCIPSRNWSHVPFISSVFYRCRNIQEFILPEPHSNSYTLKNGILFGPYNIIISCSKVHSHSYSDNEYHSEKGLLYRTGAYPIDVPETDIENKSIRMMPYHGTECFMSGDWNLDSKSLYTSYVIINSMTESGKVHIPHSHYNVTFRYCPDNISEIHVPWTDPYNTINNLICNLPESTHRNITLYVPFGTKYRYLGFNEFLSFNDIREDSLWERLYSMFYHRVLDDGLYSLKHSRWWVWVGIILTIMYGIWAFTPNIKGLNTMRTAKVFALLAFAICFWFIIYWFIVTCLFFLDGHTGNLLGCFIASIGSVKLYAFMSLIEYEYIRDLKDRVKINQALNKELLRYLYGMSCSLVKTLPLTIADLFKRFIFTVKSNKLPSLLIIAIFVLSVISIKVIPGLVYESISEFKQTDITSTTSGNIPHQRIPIYGNIKSISFSPDSKKIAVASSKSCWIIDIQSGQSDRVLHLDSEIEQVIYLSEDKIFIYQFNDSTLIWKPSINMRKRQRYTETLLPYYTHFSNPDLMCISIEDSTCFIYDKDETRSINLHNIPEGYPSAGGDNLALLNRESGTLYIHNIYSTDIIATQRFATTSEDVDKRCCIDRKGIYCFAFLNGTGYNYSIPDNHLETFTLPQVDNIDYECCDISNKYIAIAEGDKIHIIDRITNELIKTLYGVHHNSIFSIQTSESDYVLSVSSDSYTIWDKSTGDTVKAYNDPSHGELALVGSSIYQFKRDSVMVLSLKDLDTIYFGRCRQMYVTHNKNFLMTSSADSLYIYSPSDNSTRHITKHYGLKKYSISENGTVCAGWSPDGDGDSVYVINIPQDVVTHKNKINRRVRNIQFLQDNRQLLMESNDTLSIYDIIEEKLLHSEHSHSATVSNSQKHIYSMNGNFMYPLVQILDSENLKCLYTFNIQNQNYWLPRTYLTCDDKFIYLPGGTSVMAYKIPYDKLNQSDSD